MFAAAYLADFAAVVAVDTLEAVTDATDAQAVDVVAPAPAAGPHGRKDVIGSVPND